MAGQQRYAGPVIGSVIDWVCPACQAMHRTFEHRPHTPFHVCSALKGLTAPYVRAGVKAELRAVEREDYVGDDLVQTDGEGRPIQAVITMRDEGQDCTVYAPTATANSIAGL